MSEPGFAETQLGESGCAESGGRPGGVINGDFAGASPRVPPPHGLEAAARVEELDVSVACSLVEDLLGPKVRAARPAVPQAPHRRLAGLARRGGFGGRSEQVDSFTGENRGRVSQVPPREGGGRDVARPPAAVLRPGPLLEPAGEAADLGLNLAKRQARGRAALRPGAENVRPVRPIQRDVHGPGDVVGLRAIEQDVDRRIRKGEGERCPVGLRPRRAAVERADVPWPDAVAVILLGPGQSIGLGLAIEMADDMKALAAGLVPQGDAHDIKTLVVGRRSDVNRRVPGAAGGARPHLEVDPLAAIEDVEPVRPVDDHHGVGALGRDGFGRGPGRRVGGADGARIDDAAVTAGHAVEDAARVGGQGHDAVVVGPGGDLADRTQAAAPVIISADADVPGVFDELGPADERRVARPHNPAGAEALVPEVFAGGDLQADEVLGARRICGSGRGGRGRGRRRGRGGRCGRPATDRKSQDKGPDDGDPCQRPISFHGGIIYQKRSGWRPCLIYRRNSGDTI